MALLGFLQKLFPICPFIGCGRGRRGVRGSSSHGNPSVRGGGCAQGGVVGRCGGCRRRRQGAYLKGALTRSRSWRRAFRWVGGVSDACSALPIIRFLPVLFPTRSCIGCVGVGGKGCKAAHAAFTAAPAWRPALVQPMCQAGGGRWRWWVPGRLSIRPCKAH